MEYKIKNNGITMISLIVTILVLLILTGVSITMLTGENGLILQAIKAKEKTEASKVDELVNLSVVSALLSNNGNIMDRESLNQALLDNFDSEKYEILPDCKSCYQVIVGNNGYVIHPDGTIIKTNWIQIDEQTIKSVTGNVILKVGDYINYNPQKDATYANYVSTSAKNGWSNQTFNLESYNFGWRIIGIEDGNIKLISDKIIGPDSGGKSENDNTYYYLFGQKGYINGENELNNICMLFGQGKEVEKSRSINIEDILEITNYSPENGENGLPYGANTVGEYGNTISYKNNNDKIEYVYKNVVFSSEYNTLNYYDETNNNFQKLEKTNNIQIKSTYYNYTNIGIDSNNIFYTLFFKDSINSQYYWLSSKYVQTEKVTIGYGIRRVGGGRRRWSRRI